jgi:nucleotide-binding universal stress UspA family protein
MKTILVATDFSDASRNASLYAIEMAKAFNVKLILFSAYQQVPVPVNEPALIMAAEDMRKVTHQLLDQEARYLYSEKKIAIETYCKEGLTHDTILATAKEQKADLIITGMKSTVKGLRKLFGSTVTALTKKTNTPMIIVPENTKYVTIDTIAIANDSDLPPDTDHLLLYSLRYIAERFHSKVYIVRVFDDSFRDVYEWSAHPAKLERMIRTLHPLYERIDGNNVPAALNNFIKGYKVNLLAMLPHKHNFLESLFIKSTTTSMIFETRIPLLILPEIKQKQLKKVI